MKKSLPHEAYEELADSYATIVDTKPHNAYLERPAMQSLVPEINGKHILDAGCAAGWYTQWMLSEGASVTALDSSEKMITHAKNRNSDKAEFHVANLEEPLDFLSDNSFDGILSSLTITYIKDLNTLFSEFNRILRPGGWFVFSKEHPFFTYQFMNLDSYFDTKQVSCEWSSFGKKITMNSYFHSLGEISGALTDNGFVIDRVIEPKPTDDFRKANPAGYEKQMKFPLFICMRALKLNL